ncbi:MAG: hypothetical protein CME13_06670 [Gemmatimonadetes bacterium]|nr:hypothetical protein [Gemmatimonadota bacterium]MDP7362357.1 hypothetical protein [Candidatus Latescibacterota bacterium]
MTAFHLYGEMYPVILFIVDHLRIHAGHFRKLGRLGAGKGNREGRLVMALDQQATPADKRLSMGVHDIRDGCVDHRPASRLLTNNQNSVFYDHKPLVSIVQTICSQVGADADPNICYVDTCRSQGRDHFQRRGLDQGGIVDGFCDGGHTRAIRFSDAGSSEGRRSDVASDRRPTSV